VTSKNKKKRLCNENKTYPRLRAYTCSYDGKKEENIGKSRKSKNYYAPDKQISLSFRAWDLFEPRNLGKDLFISLVSAYLNNFFFFGFITHIPPKS
jgi:hypothetical protein